jgi:hypothetical protein
MTDKLHINVINDEIVVTLPGSSYSVTYSKSEDPQHLRARNYPLEVDRQAEMGQAEFLGKAWRVAHGMARQLGWTSV